MTRLKSWLMAGGIAALMSFSASDLLAQNNGGNGAHHFSSSGLVIAPLCKSSSLRASQT